MDIPKKYCHNCGKPVQLAAKFCSSCGTSLASIDEKPPIAAPQQPNRLVSKVKTTFKPMASDVDEDDDYETLKADRVESISELNISLSSLECDVRVEPVFKDSVGGLMQQGKQMPQGYTEPPRPTHPVDQKAFLEQLKIEAGTLRQSKS